MPRKRSWSDNDLKKAVKQSYSIRETLERLGLRSAGGNYMQVQSTITDLLPFPPILTKDQCEILSEADNVVSNNHLTLKDLDINPADVEEEMKKWLWRYKDGGQFAKA